METPPGPSETTIMSPPMTERVYGNVCEQGHEKQLKCVNPYLEEVILEEVSHGFVARDGPPAVQVEVQGGKPNDQN